MEPGAPAAKKRPPEPQHSDTIRRREHNCQERTAEHTNGDPGYALVSEDTKLTWVVTKASLVAGAIYFALAIAGGILLDRVHCSVWLTNASAVGVLVGPLIAAAIWIFRVLQRDYSRKEAKAAAVSYVVFAPFAVLAGNLVAVIPGGYADLALGPPFGFIGGLAGFLFIVVALSVLICHLAVRFARKSN